MTTIAKDEVTGLILAGGRGSRMGGVDKGLQLLHGLPLARHAMERLAPQVGAMMISANRNLEAYAALGAPVWPDADADFAGPLAGFLAGLSHCRTEWMVTVPCDTPRFPDDLVARLAAAVRDAPAAVAVTVQEGARQREPVFCLLRRDLEAKLAAYVRAGGRKINLWLSSCGCVDVVFPEASAFFNANTTEELHRLGTG